MEERSGGSDTDSEIMRLRERKEELEKARRTEAARARKAQREILNEVESFVLGFFDIYLAFEGGQCQSAHQASNPCP